MRAAPSYAWICLLLLAAASCGDSPASSRGDPASASLALASGDGQVIGAGLEFPQPLTVRVLDAAGRPVPGLSVDFSAESGTVLPARATTDGQGIAAARWTAPTLAGVSGVRVSIGGRPGLRFSGRVVAAPPAQLVKAVADSPRASAGDTLALAVRVTDRYDNPVAGVAVAWEVTSGGGSLSSSATTDSAGLASARWRLPSSVSSNGARATALGLSPMTFFALARPGVRRVEPERFQSGDTVRVYGRGLAGLNLFIGGSPVASTAAGDTLLAFVAPETLPACDWPLPRITLRLAHPLAATDTLLTILGRPQQAPTTVGAHAVLPLAGRAGCPVRLTAGTYGVAAYRIFGAVARDTASDLYALRIAAPGRVEGAARTVVVTRNPPARADPLAVLRPDRAAVDWIRPALSPARAQVARAAAECIRAPAAVGDTSSIITPFGDTALYRVAATSAHFSWLLTTVQLDSLTVYGRQRFDAVVDSTEARLYPFLIRTFGFLPDYDGDGRLNIVGIHWKDGSGIYAGPSRYASGCPDGDFVFIGWKWQFAPLNDSRVSLRYIVGRGIPAIVAHEATHWVDYAATVNGPPNDWTIEGIANVTFLEYIYSSTGGSFWDARDFNGIVRFGSDPTDYTVAACMPAFARYGFALMGGGAYGAGCALMVYLIDQSLLEGASSRLRLRALMPRFSYATLAPLWKQLGGGARSEEELEGEFLLALYADHVVPGISPRLSLVQYDLHDPGAGLHISFPALTVDAATTREISIPLSTPDGVVVEVVVPAGGATISIPRTELMSLAVVRRS